MRIRCDLGTDRLLRPRRGGGGWFLREGGVIFLNELFFGG